MKHDLDLGWLAMRDASEGDEPFAFYGVGIVDLLPEAQRQYRAHVEQVVVSTFGKAPVWKWSINPPWNTEETFASGFSASADEARSAVRGTIENHLALWLERNTSSLESLRAGGGAT